MGDLLGGRLGVDACTRCTEQLWFVYRALEDGAELLRNDPGAFKRGHRGLLDAVNADDLEKQRIIDECRRAFALNTAVFRELGEASPLSA
ncbi:hypothetical protein Sfulv_15520 [Streptomyces fulvorobeus]|uniref:Heme oxygenase n=2 Tax=Streptomyces fulvorobeus TaxID=284028 RepID=A0A7J0C2P5_9ACTN|nr:heme oxygenase [Streptomyces fulvorobeus]GFM96741.1 hypothetical protein Sfulv_15520 [Streptomyces fulvorobeus]